MIAAIIGGAVAGLAIAAWIFVDGFWLLELPPKKDKKFKDKKVRKLVWK